MFVTHDLVLSQARAHLAALADQAASVEASSAYERVLIALDGIYGDQVPAFEPIGFRLNADFLARMAATAIEGLERFGMDPLNVELLLAGLQDARALETS